MTIDLTSADLLHIAGELTDINLFDLITGSAGFAITKRLVDVDINGGGLDANDASLLTIGLDLTDVRAVRAASTGPVTLASGRGER